MEQLTRFIGMDVHKDTIVVAVTTAGDGGKATIGAKITLDSTDRYDSKG